jgi:hypothetical protein
MARSIESPGVEIFEKDLTLSPILPAGTNIFMTGFAPKGPSDEIIQITSVQEFEQVYGTPTNSAERYFYYGARQILNSSTGNLYVSRMPYGDGTGEGYGSTYGALVYPVVAVVEDSNVVNTVYRNNGFIDASFFQDGTYAGNLQVQCLNTPSLTSYFNTLTAAGLQTYESFTSVQKNALVAGFNNYYLNYVNNNALSSQAILAQTIANTYFTPSLSTQVTQNLDQLSGTYVLGAPKFFDLTLDQYKGVIDGSAFTNSNANWSSMATSSNGIQSPADFGKAGLIILNKIQSTINNRWEGHYVGLADNTNLETNTNHNSIRKIYTNGSSSFNGIDVTQMLEIPVSKLAFPLSATNDAGSNRNSNSISESLERVSYTFPDVASSKFDDTLSFGLFKLRTSPYNPDPIKLSFSFEEARTGSFDYYRQINNQNGGIPSTFFLENTVNKSNNIIALINPFISGKNSGSWLDVNGLPSKKVRVYADHLVQSLKDNNDGNYKKVGFHLSDIAQINTKLEYADALFPAGSYANFTTSGKALGSVTFKLDRTLRKIENDEIFDLDLVVEAGLGTIYATACANQVDYFDDTQVTDGLNAGLVALQANEYAGPKDQAGNSLEYADVKINHNAIFQIFANFCENLRKDCLFISDPLRQIFVTGANYLTTSDHNKAFSQVISNPLKNLYETANTSYATTYGNWVKINDQFAGMNIWVPFSPFAAADMANVDRNFEPWYAPAGFTRGRITNALQLAVTPKQKERDQMYKHSINPVAFFPNDGFNIFGQKTLLRQPSAFDRINVRRLFLYLEKATKKTTKYFVFEPNTLFTRNRVIAVLTPIFDRAKNTQGLYDYQIVCDKRNNPPEVIDQNELVVDIYLKPVRAAEFILVNFYATSTGANFNEIIGG